MTFPSEREPHRIAERGRVFRNSFFAIEGFSDYTSLAYKK